MIFHLPVSADALVSRSNRFLILSCIVLSVTIFAIDVMSLPLGVAAGVAYVAVVLISLWLPGPRYPILTAIGVSILIILGFLLSEPAGVPWMVATNRLLALSAIWFTTIIGNRLVLTQNRKLEDAFRLEKNISARIQVNQEGALRKAEQEAERAKNAKTRFLEIASNDMRHHLMTLSLLNGALRKTVSQAKAQEMFTQQGEALGHLGDLLNSLLELSKLESGSVEPKLTTIPIQEMFKQLQDDFEYQAQTKGLKLEFQSDGELVKSDLLLLARVVRLLLSNAIRYTKHGTVNVNCQPAKGGMRITVRDTGIGIAPDQLARIFDEFYRVENDTAARDAGLGLGLSIVERSVSLLGAKVEVESTLGQGSIFSFIVPASS